MHDNEAIPNKSNYLNSLLKAAAFRTIQELTSSESNYDSAVEMLQERFGNPSIDYQCVHGRATEDFKLCGRLGLLPFMWFLTR